MCDQEDFQLGRFAHSPERLRFLFASHRYVTIRASRACRPSPADHRTYPHTSAVPGACDANTSEDAVSLLGSYPIHIITLDWRTSGYGLVRLGYGHMPCLDATRSCVQMHTRRDNVHRHPTPCPPASPTPLLRRHPSHHATIEAARTLHGRRFTLHYHKGIPDIRRQPRDERP